MNTIPLFNPLLLLFLFSTSFQISAQQKFVEVIAEDTLRLVTQDYTILLSWEYFEEESYANPLRSKETLELFIKKSKLETIEHPYSSITTADDPNGYMDVLHADPEQYEAIKDFSEKYGNVFSRRRYGY